MTRLPRPRPLRATPPPAPTSAPAGEPSPLELELGTSPVQRDPGGIAATLTALAGALTTAAVAQGAPWWAVLAGTVVGTGAQLWARLYAWAPATVARHAREVAAEARDQFGQELEVLEAALEEAAKARKATARRTSAAKAAKAR